MSKLTFKGQAIHTEGEIINAGTSAPDFKAVKTDLSEISISGLKGKNVVLNIFPSVDTGICAASVRKFNELASSLENTTVLCLSKDLPFALGRFCGAEGLDKVIPASLFRSCDFDKHYGLVMTDGPLKGLEARAVICINSEGQVIYSQLVSEITTEPDYTAALNSLQQ